MSQLPLLSATADHFLYQKNFITKKYRKNKKKNKNKKKLRNREIERMGRFSDSDLKTMLEDDLFFEFVFENWVQVFGSFVASKACSLYFYEQYVFGFFIFI